jgi:hypothetical protein
MRFLGSTTNRWILKTKNPGYNSGFFVFLPELFPVYITAAVFLPLRILAQDLLTTCNGINRQF